MGKGTNQSREVCLVIPPSIFLLDERVFVNLGILKVGAALEARGYKVTILDLSGVGNYLDAVEDYAASRNPIAYGITSTTPQFPACVKISRRIRKLSPRSRQIIGGPHVTACVTSMKRERHRGHRHVEQMRHLFEVLVCGDGEDAIIPAIHGSNWLVDADSPKSEYWQTIGKLEGVFPARHLIDMKSYKFTIDGDPATSMIAQLGCPFRCGFSVAGDSRIFTDQGPVTLKLMLDEPEDVLYCEHGHPQLSYKFKKRVANKSDWGTSRRIVLEGVRPVFRVNCGGGLSFKATEDHPVWIARDGKAMWCKVRDLRSGDHCVVRSINNGVSDLFDVTSIHGMVDLMNGVGIKKMPTKYNLPKDLNEDLAWIMGYFAGDGCIPSDHRPSLHVALKPHLVDFISEKIRSLFGVDMSVYKASNTKKMFHGWIYGRPIHNFFRLLFNDKKLSVPDCIFQSRRSVQSAFWMGLVAADGYEDKKGGRYVATSSRGFASDLSDLLLYIGVLPWFFELKNGAFRVGEVVRDRIPVGNGIYKSLKSGKWYWRTREGYRKGVGRHHLVRSGLSHELLQDGVFYVEFKNLEPCGEEPVYDISMIGDPSFCVSGFIAHNCSLRHSPSFRRIRLRPSSHVVQEIRELYETYGYKAFMLYDDELNVNTKMVQLMDAIVSLQGELGAKMKFRGCVKAELLTDEQAKWMKRAGFSTILVGFESAHPRILENINKKATVEDNTRCMEIARANGLKVKALMSIGHPGETRETVEATKQWLLKVQPDEFNATIITCHPGTYYYDDAVDEGDGTWVYTCPKSGDRLWSYDMDYSKVMDYYNGDPDKGYHSYVFTEDLDPGELVYLRDNLEREVRRKLGIPYYKKSSQTVYEQSMGQIGAVLNTD